MTGQQQRTIVPMVDCAVCVELDAEKAAAQEVFDHSKVSDVRVLRQLHRDRGECTRVTR